MLVLFAACVVALTAPTLSASPAADADARFAGAVALFERGDAARALPLAEQAVAIDETLGSEHRPRLARDLQLLGLCLSGVGQVEDAIARLRRSVELFTQLEATEERITVLSNLGMVEYSHARYQQAEADLKQAVALSREHDLPDPAPAILNNLGLVYQAWGRYAEAIDYYQLAREEYARRGDEQNAAACLGNIAGIHLARSQFPEAEASYKEALAAFKRLGDDTNVTNTAINLGGVYRAWGRNDEAQTYLEEALADARRGGLSVSEAYALAELGAVHFRAGFYDRAESEYKSALEKFRAADNPLKVASTTTALAQVYYAWGKFEQAEQLYEQSLSLAEKMNAPAEALEASAEICSVQLAQGRIETAVSCYRRALQLAEKLGDDSSRANLHNFLGIALLEWRRFDEAEAEYREALAISERLEQRGQLARALIHLGGVRQVKGDYEAARELYLRGLDLTRALGAKADEAVALNNLALVANDPQEAERYLLEAIDIKEQLRLTAPGEDRRDFLASWISTYRSLVLLYALDDNPAATFDAGERMKARYLAERIGAQKTAARAHTQGIEAARRGLGPRTAILSFANADWQQPLAIVATRETLSLHTLFGSGFAGCPQCEQAGLLGHRVPVEGGAAAAAEKAGRLGDLLSSYQALLYKPNPSTADDKEREKLARELYARLIAPFEQQLAGKDELIVIPDGALAALAFETLRLPDDRFLVERYHVTYLPSLGIRQLLDGRRYGRRLRPLLAFANAGQRVPDGAPVAQEVTTGQLEALRIEAQQRLRVGTGACDVYRTLGASSWPALPGAAAEAEALSQIAPGSTILRDERASEGQLKALSRTGALRRFGSLHFATHGVLVPDAPELSALILAEARDCGHATGTEDGYLSAQEIAGLDIQADFVALSACKTGLGKIYGGEGVVGLAQAFLEAGANGMAVSLSSVLDAATKDLMTGLYRLVRRDGLSYAHALTAMKRRFIRRRDRRLPSFWAPFVYYGI